MTICKRDWIIFERREKNAPFDFFTSALHYVIISVHLYKYVALQFLFILMAFFLSLL